MWPLWSLHTHLISCGDIFPYPSQVPGGLKCPSNFSGYWWKYFKPLPQSGEISQALIKALGKNTDLPLATGWTMSIANAAPSLRDLCLQVSSPSASTELFSSFLTPENVPSFQLSAVHYIFSCGILLSTLQFLVVLGVWVMTCGKRSPYLSISVVKNMPASSGDVRGAGSIPGSVGSPEKEMATHSSILAWRIPQKDEPGGYSPCGHEESDMTEMTQHTALPSQQTVSLKNAMDQVKLLNSGSYTQKVLLVLNEWMNE